jgi:hypothetical protein
MRDIAGNGLDFLHENEIGDTDGDGMLEILDAWGTPLTYIRWPAGFVVHPGPDHEWGVAGTDDDSEGTTDELDEAAAQGSDDIPYFTNLQRIQLDPNDTQLDSLNQPLHVAPEIRDPFDPFRMDQRPTNAMGPVPMFTQPSTSKSLYYFNFAMHPLIASAGADKALDLVVFDFDPTDPNMVPVSFDYYRSGTNNFGGVFNDPYSIMPTCRRRLGEPFIDSFGYLDNITNHASGQ